MLKTRDIIAEMIKNKVGYDFEIIDLKCIEMTFEYIKYGVIIKCHKGETIGTVIRRWKQK